MKDELMKKYFYKDGSLRDIYVLHSHHNDGDILMNYFKSNHDFSLSILKDGEKFKEQLSTKEIIDLKNDFSIYILIDYKGISILGYFYETNHIEFDINPNVINSHEEFDNIVEFMEMISMLTNKEVILTPEMEEKEVYIRVLPTREKIYL